MAASLLRRLSAADSATPVCFAERAGATSRPPRGVGVSAERWRCEAPIVRVRSGRRSLRAPATMAEGPVELPRGGEQRDRDAPVLVTACGTAIGGDRPGLPQRLHLDPIPLDTTSDEEAPHLVGAALTQLQVLVRRADVVSVAFQFHPERRIVAKAFQRLE